MCKTIPWGADSIRTPFVIVLLQRSVPSALCVFNPPRPYRADIFQQKGVLYAFFVF
jgi:hypothetical protein